MDSVIFRAGLRARRLKEQFSDFLKYKMQPLVFLPWAPLPGVAAQKTQDAQTASRDIY